MNIKLAEWNELVRHGKKLCNILIENGYDARLKHYTMYDGRKGLKIQLFDDFGNFFTEYCSGIDTYNVMRMNMDMIVRRIMKEC